MKKEENMPVIKILAVDDDQQTLTLLREILTNDKFVCTMTTDGEGAWKKLRTKCV